MPAGVLATDTPARPDRGARRGEPRGRVHLPISRKRSASGAHPGDADCQRRGLRADGLGSGKRRLETFSLSRLLAYSIRETLEFCAIPIRLGFAFLGTAFLMVVFGLGITTDVNQISFAVLDRDNTPESRAYLEELRGSRYFVERSRSRAMPISISDCASAGITPAIEIPPGFGRDIRRGRPAEVGAWIDGAMPFRAETIRGYLAGVHQHYLADLARDAAVTPAAAAAGRRSRSGFATTRISTASTPWCRGRSRCCSRFIPAILMALAIVREKELGSITNLYVTPVTRLEFLLGKQLPYIAVAMVNFALMLLMAVFLFECRSRAAFRRSRSVACSTSTATTGYGMVISVFTRTQIAALFGTAILTSCRPSQFSGMMTPVSSLTGLRRFMAHDFPDDLFPADQRRHLHQGARLRGSGRRRLRRSLSSFRC